MGDGDDGSDGIGGIGTGFGESAPSVSANENDNGLGSFGLGGFGQVSPDSSIAGAAPSGSATVTNLDGSETTFSTLAAAIAATLAAAIAAAIATAPAPAIAVESEIASPPPSFTTVHGFNGQVMGLAPSFAPADLGVVSFDPNEGFAPDFGLSLANPFDGPPAAPAAPAATLGQTLQAVGQTLLGLLGIVSGTPQGIIGGGMSVSNGLTALGGIVGSPAPSVTSGGFSGDSPGDGSTASNAGFGFSSGAYGGPVAGGVASGLPGSPVLSFNGAPLVSSGSAGGLLSSLFPGLSARPLMGNTSNISDTQPAISVGALLLGAAAFFLVV